MRGLASAYGARIVPTIMTRAQREGELEKTTVTPDEFDALERIGTFLHVTRIYGTRYGTRHADIRRATEETSTAWLLDFPYSHRNVFAGFKHVEVLIVPESPDLHARQLRESGRHERVEQALGEQRTIYAPLLARHPHAIVNRHGDPESTIKAAAELLGGILW